MKNKKIVCVTTSTPINLNLPMNRNSLFFRSVVGYLIDKDRGTVRIEQIDTGNIINLRTINVSKIWEVKE